MHVLRVELVTTIALLLSAVCGVARADDSQRFDKHLPVKRPSVLDRFSDLSNKSTGSHIHGIAQPIHSAKISSPIAATLVSVNVKEGDLVEKGDILAVLDNRVANASVIAARVAAKRVANIQLADAQVRFSESYLERLKGATKGAVSEVEISEAAAQVERAVASAVAAREELAQANANLELEESKLEAHNIRAPFAGRVIRLHTTPGELPSAGKPIIEMADVSRLRAELFLPPEWYGELSTSREYALRAGSPLKQIIRGTFIYGEPRIDAASDRFRCVFEIDNHEMRYPSGFSVRFEASTLDDNEPTTATQ